MGSWSTARYVRVVARPSPDRFTQVNGDHPGPGRCEPPTLDDVAPPTGSRPSTPPAHRGERFGLPAGGQGSVAGFVRRVAALAVDWMLAYLVSGVFLGPDAFGTPQAAWIVLGIWFVLTAVPVAAFGATPGMIALGIRVASVDGPPLVGVPRALVRTALVALVLPPLFRDDDGRGWHDLAARTVVVRTR